MKYSWEFKLECVEEYLKGRWKEKPGYAKCSDRDFHTMVAIWARLYKLYGTDGLKQKHFQKDWTPEERYELVAEVLAGKPITSAAIEAGINKGQLYQWVRKYELYGYDGLKLKKGRKPKRPVMNKDKPKELTKSEKEELILLRKQNEYLKAENAYLKKLRALIVQKKAESSVKAKRQPSSKDSEQKDTD